jgi:hypothetical protein
MRKETDAAFWLQASQVVRPKSGGSPLPPRWEASRTGVPAGGTLSFRRSRAAQEEPASDWPVSGRDDKLPPSS